MADPEQNPIAQGASAENEDVDQFYDDGGETFLPADHVSNNILARVASSKLGGIPLAICN